MDEKFDILLDQALAEFASQEPETKKEQRGYKDYVKFLQEISEDDENLARVELSILSEIDDTVDDSEQGEVLAELKDNSDNWYNKSKWKIDERGVPIRSVGEAIFQSEEDEITDNSLSRPEQLLIYNQKKKQNRELRKVEINRMAFDQKILPLNDLFTVERKRVMIEILTEPWRRLLVKYEDYINTKVTKLLAPVIPGAVKLAFLKWPWIFVPNPGFLYKTGNHYGEPKTFWVNPKLPYFFKQGTEQTILEERDATLSKYFLDCIDRAVQRYYAAKDKLVDREISFAAKMATNIKGNTYYHLLKLNPFWFDKLYKYVRDNDPLM